MKRSKRIAAALLGAAAAMILYQGCNSGGGGGNVTSLSCAGLKIIAQDDNLQLTGTLKVSALMPPDMKTSQYQYLLKEDSGVVHQLQFKGKAPGYRTGDRLKVSGRIDPNAKWTTESGPTFADSVIVDAVTSMPVMRTMSFPYSLGAQSTLAILVSFSDQPTSYTLAGAQDTVFNQVNNFWLEASFGKTWITGKVVGPYAISMPAASCNTTTMSSLAQAAAQAAGENPGQYAHLVYIFSRNTACGSWVGLADVGGSKTEAWINGGMSLQTISHEMGHNLGMYHANAWDCGTGASIGSSCSSIEYGDPGDSMGTMIAAQYNAYHKEQLGWLGGAGTPSITQVTASGVYSLEPYETNTTGVKALKILKSNDTSGHTYYYVEYRQPLGTDVNFNDLSNSNLTSGVEIHTGTDYDDNTSYLINMNPSLANWDQAALNIGQTFTDGTAGVSITLDSAGAAGAQVSVSLNGTPPPANPGNPSGTITLNLSSSSVNPGDFLGVTMNSSVANAAYTLTVTGPGNFKIVKTGTVDGLGNAQAQFQINSCAQPGTYSAAVALDGGTAAATSQFEVK